jgi:hypothetical protein
LLPLLGKGWENRFLQPWQMLVISVACLSNHGIAMQGFYILARKGLPFFLQSAIAYSVVAFSVVLGAGFHGVSGLSIGYAISMTCVALPLHTWAYWRYRSAG